MMTDEKIENAAKGGLPVQACFQKAYEFLAGRGDVDGGAWHDELRALQGLDTLAGRLAKDLLDEDANKLKQTNLPNGVRKRIDWGACRLVQPDAVAACID
jgi:hypothetical protein